MTDFQGLLGGMWLDVWGNTVVGCIAILAAFFFLTWKKRLGVGETALVVMPVLMGITTDNYLPIWIRGLFFIPIGLLWGMAVLRITGIR